METLSCEQCGTPVYISDKFCPHCGTPQNQKHENCVVCETCRHKNVSSSSFCEKCGTGLNPKSTTQKIQPNDSPKIVSQGNYSGKRFKGKTSRSWKIFRNIIIGILLIGILALIIWFRVDPEAGKKLTDVALGIAFMAVFFFVGWLFMRGNKGNKRDWDYD